MAVKWAEVAASEKYQGATPELKTQIQDKFFDTQIKTSPKYKPEWEGKIKSKLFGRPPEKGLNAADVFGYSIAEAVTRIPRQLAEGITKRFPQPSLIEQRKTRLEQKRPYLSPEQILKEESNIKQVEDFLTLETSNKAKLDREITLAKQRHPVAKFTGEVIGGLGPAAATVATGLPLWAGFGGLGILEEVSRQFATPEEQLTPPQRAAKVSVSGAAGAVTGAIFRQSDLGKTFLNRAIKRSAGAGATAITENIIDEFASGRQPDVGQALAKGSLQAVTIGVLSFLTELPELRGSVWTEAQNLASRSGRAIPKTYEEAKAMVREAYRNPEELSPQFQRAQKEFIQAGVRKSVKENISQYKAMGYDEAQTRDLLSIKSLTQFDEVAGKYAKINPDFVQKIMPFRKAIANGIITPEEILMALEVNKMAQAPIVAEEVIKPAAEAREPPAAKPTVTPAEPKASVKPSEPAKQAKPVVELPSAQKEAIQPIPVNLPEELTKGDHLLTPDQSYEKTRQDLAESRYTQEDIFSNTVSGPLESNIKALKDQKAQLGKGKATAEARKDIDEKIKEYSEQLNKARGFIEEQDMKFGTGVANMAIQEAQKQGLDLGEFDPDWFENGKISEDWGQFRDDIIVKIFDETYAEAYWQTPVKDIVQETIDQWKEATSPEVVAKEAEIEARRMGETEEITIEESKQAMEKVVQEHNANAKEIEAIKAGLPGKLTLEIENSAAKITKPGESLEENIARTKDWISSTLDNDPSTNEELIEYFQKEGGFSKEVAEYLVSKRQQVKALPLGVKKESKGEAKGDEFNVGDILDPQGNTNMVGKVTIREINKNTIKFTDSEGTEFSGMSKSQVKELIEGGSWRKESRSVPLTAEQKNRIDVITDDEQLAEIVRDTSYTSEYRRYAQDRLKAVLKEQALRESHLEKKADSNYKLVGYYDTTGETEKEITEYGSKAPERKFKKDLTKYAKALKDELGWEWGKDKKGKELKPDTNIAPIGGDGSIVLFKPGSDWGIYISISTDRVDGDNLQVGGTMGAIMFRATTRDDPWGGESNNWAKTDISVGEFAKTIKKNVDFYSTPVEVEQKPLTKEEKYGKPEMEAKDVTEIESSRESREGPSGNAPDISGGESVRESTPVGGPERRQQSVQSEVKRARSRSGSQTSVSGQQETTETQRKTSLGNYQITDSDNLGVGSPKEKFRSNVEAIKLLKTLEKENRKATPEEQAILVKYVGWGGLSKAFDQWGDWEKEYKQLEKLLTEEEFEAARASTINAHYTSREVIDAMWQAVTAMGFNGGKVLEPAMGVGHFLGLRPDGLSLSFTGVELDSLTGRIAKQLYQGADVYIEGFEKVNLPKNFYDLAISNVPFADYKPYDPRAEFLGIPRNLMLHDYFFAKSLSLIKPGGIVAFITSKGTMDKQDPKLREWISKQADLLGAIRLPNTAFKANAGTEVVTDIIFLRKRFGGEKPSGEEWVNSTLTKISNRNISVNGYFLKNTSMVLGNMKVGRGMYTEQELTVDPLPEPLVQSLNKAIDFLPKDVIKENVDIIEAKRPDEIVPDSSNRKAGAFVLKDGKIHQVTEEGIVPKDFGADNTRVIGMMQIRDAIRDLLAHQESSAEDTQLKSDQKRLNDLYDKFVKKFGYLNSPKNEDLFWDDPDTNLIVSLENEDKKTKTFTKADIFTKRINFPHTQPTEAESAQDGIKISLSEYGHLNWDYISKITGRAEEDLQKELSDAGLIFKNPEGEKWVLSDEYLSGNVKLKLKLAEAASKIDITYNRNIEELRKVIPPDLSFQEIIVRLGTPWVETQDYKTFIGELLDTDPNYVTVEHNSAGGQWTMSLASWVGKFSAANTQKWGTERFPAIDLMEAIANHRLIQVKDKIREEGEDRYVINEQETTAAQDKAEILKQKFSDWFWTDEARRNKYLKLYNDNFNNTVTRKYNGDHLTLPGMSDAYKPRKTQLDAIWRGVQTKSILLAHEVGAGKTLIMVATAMESKRLGLTNKPIVVVPKNTLPQWKREWNKIYPAANILVADERNFVTTRRKRFLSKIATGDYDAIVLADSSFFKIGVSEKLQREYIKEQLDELREIKSRYEDDGSKASVKQIEKSIKKLEEKLERRLDQEAKDETIAFEELGIDMVMVDEADRFKNLAYSTKMENVRGLGDPSGNLRTEDMMMKLRLIRQRNGKIVFATGTPISNTMAETHAVMKYLQPEILEERGLKHFDDWANAFGEIVTSLEVDATGGRYKAVSRFSKFVNLPDLISMLGEVWDIQTAEMLEQQGILVKGKNLPLLKGGKATPTVLNPTVELKEYIQELGRRADAIKGKRPEKGGDNMLVILHDGIMASTDMRLIDPGMPASPDSKIEFAINGIYERWNRTKDTKGTQLIFIDRVAPDKTATFNPQYYMVNKLITMGISKEEIALIHDYDTLDKKDDLYRKVNDGEVRILFGSTEKLGAGTNVQERLITLWHMDTPFRPRDIMQREGRIMRPGNTNKEVEIMRLVTKGSLDTFMWQMLESKVKAISQVMSGQSKDRIMAEEVDEYAIIKAASSDNPLLREKVEVDKEVRRLTNLRNSFLDQKFKAQKEIKGLPEEIERLKTNIEGVRKDISQRPGKLTKDNFTIEINGNSYKDKETAWQAMKQVVDKIDVSQWGKDYIPLGKYQGFPLFIFVSPPTATTPRVTRLILRGASVQYDATYSESAIGTFASIDIALYAQPEQRLSSLQINIDNATKHLEISKELAEKQFEHEKTLEDKQKRQVEINRELKKEAEGKDVTEMHAGIPITPYKKEPIVNDKIETGEVKFIDPEVEERFKAAHGQHPDALRFKIKEWWGEFTKSATREYPELPNDPKYAHIREILRKQQNSKSVAQEQAIRNMDDILLGFGPKKLDLFTRAVILADLAREAEAGHPIPFGYSSYDEGGNLFINKDLLEKDKANVDRVVELNPDVKQSLEKRKATWKDITAKLVYYKILTPEQLKEDYFRHQVLDYANNKATFGTGKKLRTPTPKYAKRRFGSAEHDINTNYLEAEFEVMSQALHDIQTARNIDQVRESPLNIKDRLKEEARLSNKQMADRITVQGMTDKDGNPITVTDALKPYSRKMGFGFNTLSKLGYEFLEGEETVFEELANLINDENAPENAKIAAKMILKASADRRQAMKDMLGVNYKEWRDLVPVDHTTWQPKEGRTFFSVMTVSQRIVNNVLENITIEGITRDDLGKILAVGQLREEFVLPVEVAKTLDNLYEIKPQNIVRDGAKFLTTQWKKWVLFNPRRLFKYNYQNFLGDTDAVIAGNPRVFKNFPRANQELIDMFYKGQPMTQEMREYFERGGLKSQMTIQEVPEINTLEAFDRFRANAEKSFDLAGSKNIMHQYWNKAVEFTVYRESILRYAAYLYYRDVFKSGKSEYGASIKSEIDGLVDPLDKAAKVATELLGDYGTITALGKDIRETLIPFYSWMEINFKRYKRLAQNEFDDGFSKGLSFVGRAAASGTSRATIMGSLFLLKWLIRASAMTLLVALYNQIFHPDEEKELNVYDQNRMHLTIGRDKTGKPIILRGQGAFADLMEWVGLDRAFTLWRDYIDGKESLTDIVGKIPLVTGKVGLRPLVLKFLRGINPLYKLPAETFTGKTIWGLEERSGKIEDKFRNIARALQLENEYDWITRKPSRGYARSLWEAAITTTDPEENAFRYIQSQKHAYLEKKGKGGTGDYYTPRSVLYRQYKKALAYKDEAARVRAVKEMMKLGVTMEDLERSLKTNEPFYGLNEEEKIDFARNFLTQRDRELAKRAYRYYIKTFLRTNR